MAKQFYRKAIFLKAFFLCILLLAPSLATAEQPDDQAAIAAAIEFLQLIDARKYSESWEQGAPHFQSMVAQTQWVSQMENNRRPLGAVRNREVRSARLGTALPDAPVGQCYVLQFRTSFQNRDAAIETVMMHQSPEGEWRAAQYFVR